MRRRAEGEWVVIALFTCVKYIFKYIYTFSSLLRYSCCPPIGTTTFGPCMEDHKQATTARLVAVPAGGS